MSEEKKLRKRSASNKLLPNVAQLPGIPVIKKTLHSYAVPVILLHSHSTVFEQPKDLLWIWKSFWRQHNDKQTFPSFVFIFRVWTKLKLKSFQAEFRKIVFLKIIQFSIVWEHFSKCSFETHALAETSTQQQWHLHNWPFRKKMRIGFTSKKITLINWKILFSWLAQLSYWSELYGTEVKQQLTDRGDFKTDRCNCITAEWMPTVRRWEWERASFALPDKPELSRQLQIGWQVPEWEANSSGREREGEPKAADSTIAKAT